MSIDHPAPRLSPSRGRPPHPRLRLALACVAASLPCVTLAQTPAVGPIVNPATGSTYTLYSGPTDWHQYQAFARSLGGNLVTINDAAEQAWVYDNVGRFQYAYIGVNDADAEGAYAWASDQPLSFTFWSPFAFGDPLPRDYGFMSIVVPLTGEWLLASNNTWSHAIIEVGNADACAGAFYVATPSQGVFNLAGATPGPQEQGFCGLLPQFNPEFNGPAKWYAFEGTGGPVVISTQGPNTNFDTVLHVLKGACGSLTCDGFNDDAVVFQDVRSRVEITTECGELYYALVRDFSRQATQNQVFDLLVTPASEPTPAWQDFFVGLAPGPTYGITSPTTWPAARALARASGVDLAAITTPSENGEVAGIVSFYLPTAPFIGLSNYCDLPALAWSNGEPLGFTNWPAGQPTDPPGADAAVINTDGSWTIAPTADVRPAVAEFHNDLCDQAVPLPLPGGKIVNGAYGVIQPNEIPCGTVAGGGEWLRFVGAGTNVTISACRAGFFATVNASIRVFEGGCANLTCLASAPDNPAAQACTDLVVYAEAGRDYYVLVSGSGGPDLPYYAVSLTPTPAEPPTLYPVLPFDPVTCARYVILGPTGWSNARDAARTFFNADLPCIQSQAQNDFLADFASTFIPPGQPPYFWLNATDRDAEGDFRCADGSAPPFTNWAPGFPDNFLGLDDYAVLFAGSGLWGDVPRDFAAFAPVQFPVTDQPGGVIRGALALPGWPSSIPLQPHTMPQPDATSYLIETWFRTAAPGVLLAQTGSTTGGYVPTLYIGTDGRIRAADWAGDTASSLLTGPVVTDNASRHVALARGAQVLLL